MPARAPRLLRRLKNDFIFGLLRFAIGLARLFPYGTGARLGARLGGMAYAILPVERRRVREHLRIAFGDVLPERDCDRIGRECFANLGAGLFELLNFGKVRHRYADVLSCDTLHYMAQARARGRGTIVVTAHAGNWELLAAYASLSGFAINVVARDVYDSRINDLLVEFRAANGVRTIPRGDLAGGRKILRALRANEVLALVIDQDTKVPGVFVDFFGRKAFTPAGAAELALKCDATVLTAFSARRPDGGLHLVFGPPLDLVRAGDAARDVHENTRRFTALIEEHVRAHPGQWVWMHRRWKTRPGGFKERERKPEANPWVAHFVARPLFGALSRIVSVLPRRAADRCGDALGALMVHFVRSRRRVAVENLRTAFGDALPPERRDAIVRTTFQTMTKNVFLYFREPALDRRFFEEEVEIEGLELLDAALKKGRGVIIVGGHIGSWELAMFKVAACGYPLNLVAKRMHSAQTDAFLVETRRRMGVRTIVHRDSAWDVMRVLRRGGIVVAVMDQNMKRSQGIFADFFGVPACTVKSTAALAAHARPALLLGYALRLPDGRHRVVMEDSLEFAYTGDRDADLLANTQKCNDALADVARRYPEQWFWLHRRWKTRPEAAKPR